jgi:hypothetical protein
VTPPARLYPDPERAPRGACGPGSRGRTDVPGSAGAVARPGGPRGSR